MENDSSLLIEPAPIHQRHLAATVGTQLILQSVGILTGAVVSRLLGVDGRGLMAVAYTWAVAIAYLGDLGGPIAFTFFAARNKYSTHHLEANSYWLAAAQFVLLALVGAPLIAVVLSGQKQTVAIAEWFLIAFLPLNLLQRYLQAILQGHERFLAFGVSTISVQVVYAVAAVILLVLHHRSVQLILGSIILGNAVTVLVSFWALGRPARPAALDLKLVRETIAYGLRAHLGNIAPIERLQIDVLIVSALLGTFSTGLYVVAASVASLPRFLGFAIGMVALPQVAAGRTHADRVAAAGAIFRLALIMLFVVTVGLELVIGYLIPLIYGEQFRGAVGIARVLLLGAMAASLRRTLGDCFRGWGHPTQASVAEIVGWVIAAIGIAVLVPIYGVLGAADAVTLCFLASLAVSIVFAWRIGISPANLFVPRSQDFRSARTLVNELATGLGSSLGR